MNTGRTLQDSLRLFCRANGFTFTKVAEYVGISRYHLSNWLNGREDLNEKRIDKITDFVNGKTFRTLTELEGELKWQDRD